MENSNQKRSLWLAKARSNRVQTNKIIDRITFIHKSTRTKSKRSSGKSSEKVELLPITPAASLKFGSLNINGLDFEASLAVDQLLTTKGFDVSITIFFLSGK